MHNRFGDVIRGNKSIRPYGQATLAKDKTQRPSPGFVRNFGNAVVMYNRAGRNIAKNPRISTPGKM